MSLISRFAPVRLVIAIILSATLAVLPLSAMPTSVGQGVIQQQDAAGSNMKKSSGEAVMRTQTSPLKYAPSIDEIKRQSGDPSLRKVPTPTDKLPTADRCRPADRNCQDYWKKIGKPSSNIGLLNPKVIPADLNLLSNLVAHYIRGIDPVLSPLFVTSGVSEGLGVYKSRTSAASTTIAIQGGVTYGDWQTEMTQGRNRMGGDGEDLFAGNYSWSRPILSLPGRAGHDFGLSLTYNSHQWVKTLSTGVMQMLNYAELIGGPGGGFFVGLPYLRPYLHTTRNGQNAYLLVLPSGKAIELIRRGGPANSQIYESIDGSILHLVVEGSSNQYLFYPDGTRLHFSNFYCDEVKDRNGNQITATYGSNPGQIQTITDTLGRQINFTYGQYFEISTITQTRKDENGTPQTVHLADFGYSNVTINTNFASTSYVANGTVIPMLTTAKFADGSIYTFAYTSYGQVKTIAHYAPQVANPSMSSLCAQGVTSGCDYRLLAYSTYNLPSTTDSSNNAVQTDCPRFTSRFDWALEWNAGVTTSFSNASDRSWGQVTVPDGTIQRQYFNLATLNSESWKDGLPYKAEFYANGQTPGSSTPKKTTLTGWENNATWGPRVFNSTVTDGENGSSRYSEFQYNQNYNLLTDTATWKGTNSAGMMLTYANNSYLLNTTYIKTNAYGVGQRWIIGLPSASYSYGPNDAAGTSYTTLSKTTFTYDESAYLEHQLPPAGSIVNHDTSNFGLSFVAGRGNQTTVTQWDASDESNSTKAIPKHIKFNTTGSPTTQYLPDNNLTGRTAVTSYLDSFSDSTTNNTLAYPTTVTDPDGNQSKVQYRYDIGAVTRFQDPKMIAADSSKGVVRTYDPVGRLTRVDNQFSSGYTRYTYDTAFYWMVSYSKADDSGNELYNTTIYDGAGRNRATVTAHPGSAGGNRSMYNVYDSMGRLIQWSNPTEINGAWSPSGDDAAGYVWSQKSYDWNGRPLVITNQDGSTKSYSYGGCGCTGEATITFTDEVGRKVRQVSDTYLDNAMKVDKTEVLNLDGASVYSTTATVAKPLERTTYLIQTAGATTDYSACTNGNCNSTTRQQTTTTFDGFGRVIKRQVPQQSGASPFTSYSYYADSSVQTSADARGAAATVYYNARGLATNVNYAVPSGVDATPNVSFSYDSNGNRLTMTDAVGSVAYSYDTLSRLLSETRSFTGLSGTFPLSYDYYQATGLLKKITDPAGDSITYSYDLSGRTTSITGTPFAGVTSYASSISYRAWDGTKGLNGTTSMSYDSMMRVARYQVGSTLDVNYSYFADSRLNLTTNATNHLLDRVNSYSDPKGRMSQSIATAVANAPQYSQSFAFDVFDNISSRIGNYWWMPSGTTFTSSSTYVNNKLASGSESGQTASASYDNQGNMTSSMQNNTQTSLQSYDAASRQTNQGTTAYDGDGNIAKTLVSNEQTTYFFLNSTILSGALITSINAANGTKASTSVYSKGQLLAKQINTLSGPGITFFRRDPHGLIDTTADTAWVDPMNVAGKAVDSTYIANYQQGVYGHPDPMAIAANSSLFYPGSEGNRTPGQTQVCELNGLIKHCSQVRLELFHGTAQATAVLAGLTQSEVDNGFSIGGIGQSFTRSSNSVNFKFGGDEHAITGGADQIWGDLSITFVDSMAELAVEPDRINTKTALRAMGFSRYDSIPCQAALSSIGKTTDSLERADAIWDNVIEVAAQSTGVPASLLAALSVKESGVQNSRQKNGKGRGYTQLDLGAWKKINMTEEQAMDPMYNFSFAARNIKDTYDKATALGYSTSISWAAAIFQHNTGPSRWKGAIKKVTEQNLSEFDKNTEGGRNHYTSDVLNIWHSCF